MALAKKMLPFFGVALVLHMALLLVVFQLPEHSLEAAPAPTLSLLPAGVASDDDGSAPSPMEPDGDKDGCTCTTTFTCSLCKGGCCSVQ